MLMGPNYSFNHIGLSPILESRVEERKGKENRTSEFRSSYLEPGSSYFQKNYNENTLQLTESTGSV